MNVTNKNKLLSKVRSEFQDEIPSIKLSSLAISYGLDRDVSAVIGKAWEDLEIEDFDVSSHLFFSLPESALPYYLGALMYLSMEEDNFETLALDSLLIGTKRFRKKTNRADPIVLLLRGSLSARQLKIFGEFLEYAATNGRGEVPIGANTLLNELIQK